MHAFALEHVSTELLPIIAKPYTGKRLISTQGLSHQEWLDVRKTGIGGSEAAAACGLNPYMSMLELWMIKTGRQSSTLKENIQEDSYAPLYWGKELEPVIAKFYTAKTGHKVRRVNAVLQHPDPDKSFMLANLDYAVNKADVGVLEIKTAGQYGAKLWKDGVPIHVLCQVQHQLAVTGKQLAHVCVLICGHEARLFEIRRDDQLIDLLVKAERRFWDYVLSDTPPPADGSESSAQAIQSLYPCSQAGMVDYRDDKYMDEWFNQLVDARNHIEQFQKIFDFAKQQIQLKMRDAEGATFSRGTISWKRSKDSTALDTKTLLKEHPELLEQYPLRRKGSRRFLLQDH